jgi:hypothetical protein
MGTGSTSFRENSGPALNGLRPFLLALDSQGNRAPESQTVPEFVEERWDSPSDLYRASLPEQCLPYQAVQSRAIRLVLDKLKEDIVVSQDSRQGVLT